MAEKPKTLTEQLMARKAARKPFSQQTPGDVLQEVFHDAARVNAQTFVSDSLGGTDTQIEGRFDLDAIARAFLHKVMASG